MAEVNTYATPESLGTVTEQPASSTGLAVATQALGLDSKLLLAQVINFLILMWLLRRFLYQPVVNLLERRRTEIERSLKQAAEIDERFKQWEAEEQRRTNETKAEAAKIIDEAKKAGEELRQQTLTTAQAESERLLQRTQAQLAIEKERLLNEVKKEIGQLVVAATARVIHKKLDASAEQPLIEQAVKEVSR